MGAKNKPYSGNKPRSVNLGSNYAKRKGSEFFHTSATVRGKRGSSLTAGYTRRKNETQNQFEKRVLRAKKLTLSGSLPIGKGQVIANIARDSSMENIDVNHPRYKFSDKYKSKPNWSGGIGATVPLGKGTANIDMYHDPGQASAGRKNITGFNTSLDFPIKDVQAYLRWKEQYGQVGGRSSTQSMGAYTDFRGGNLGVDVSQSNSGGGESDINAMLKYSKEFNKGGKVKKRGKRKKK